jgi:hypothetical protein
MDVMVGKNDENDISHSLRQNALFLFTWIVHQKIPGTPQQRDPNSLSSRQSVRRVDIPLSFE